MSYIPNPKMEGSGMMACIPQENACPLRCADCFFQSGRSYLEPLAENLPNIPEDNGHVIRVNDGNDSSVHFPRVVERTKHFKHKFYNTSQELYLAEFPGPVVLTVNPGSMTNKDFTRLDTMPVNLMFIRFRTTGWNLTLAQEAAEYYTERGVPVVLTFMAFFDTKVQDGFEMLYEWRHRTTNEYMAIKSGAWKSIMKMFDDNPLVHSCGQEGVSSFCRHCGNCLREYFATLERIKEWQPTT